MNITLSDHFTFKKIILFTISPILMMLFTSLYGIVDGFFISNYAGLNEYAGVNLIMPVVMIIGGIGFMFGTGGSALTGKFLGENNKQKANETFSMMLIIESIVGIIISLVGFIFVKPIVLALGKISTDTTEEMITEAIKYGSIICLGQVFFMLETSFQNFLVVDEKPRLAFIATLFAGVSNMILDFLFIKVLEFGVIGAAIATVLGYIIGALIPFIHFINNDNGLIKLTKTKLDFKIISNALFNGSSEFVNNISSCVVGLVFNIQLLKYYGQDGISAYGTIMYISFLFVSIYIGYSIGIAPVISFNYGAKNKEELKSVLKNSLLIIGLFSLFMFIMGETLSPIFSKLYVGSEPDLLKLTIKAFKIYSIHFLLCGYTIYLSSFFTALNNGLISALISFLRTLVFQILFVFTLPILFGKEAIWWSSNASELMAFLLSFIFLILNNKKYGYIK